MREGIFSDTLNTAWVLPLLKKTGLDLNTFASLRSEACLKFLNELLEKAAYQQLQDFLESQGLLGLYQPGFHMKHSVEITVRAAWGRLLWEVDTSNISLLVLLDLSASFDTLDHDILLTRLQDVARVSDTVCGWFCSFLSIVCL